MADLRSVGPSQDEIPAATQLNTTAGRREARNNLLQRLEKADTGAFSGELPSRVAYNECRALLTEVVHSSRAIAPQLKWVKETYETAVQLQLEHCMRTLGTRRLVHEHAGHDASLRMLGLREQELKQRIGIVKADTARLRKKAEEVREEMERRKQRFRDLRDTEKQRQQCAAINQSERHALLKIMPRDSSLDVMYLQNKLAELEQEMADLVEKSKQKLVPKERARPLEEELSSVEMHQRIPLIEQEKKKKRQENLMVIAMKAAEAYEEGMKYTNPTISITRHVVNTLNQAQPCDYQSSDHVPAVDDNEEVRSQRKALLSLDTFGRLMEEKRYHDAAVLAAHQCPAVLRNRKTLEHFLNAERSETVPEPFLCYCTALVCLHGSPMDDIESVECSGYMLKKDMLNEVEKWWIMKKLSASPDVAKLLLDHHDSSISREVRRRALRLAEAVYTRCGAHGEALVCVLRQGQVSRMLSLARKMTALTRADLIQVLRSHPSAQVGLMLLSEDESPCQPALTAAEVLTSLVEGGDTTAALSVAAELFGVDAEKLGDFTMQDNRTAKSEWLRLVDLCSAIPLLESLGGQIVAACNKKFPGSSL